MAAQHKRPEVSTKSPSEPQIKKKTVLIEIKI